MKGKKILAGIMVGSLLTAATSGLAFAGVAPDEPLAPPDEASAASVGPAVASPTPETTPETVSDAAPEGEPVPISDESEGSPIPISDESAAPLDPLTPIPEPDVSVIPISATVEPSAVATSTTAPRVTLTDLAQVAAYVLGKGDLTPEQERTFDLDGNGEITFTDLTRMAAVYELSMNPLPSLPVADAEHATTAFRGTISEIEANEHTIWIESSAEGEEGNIVGAVFDDETMFVDCVTGNMVRTAALAEGDRVVAYLDTHMMLSEPPKAACPALITNVPEELGQADYVYVTEVREGRDGSVVVFNQNADLYITIPADLEIGVYGSELTGEPSTASLSDIKVGSRLIVWYDLVLTSYPGQTTALRCLIDLDS